MSAVKIILKCSIFQYFRGKIKIKFNLFFKFLLLKRNCPRVIKHQKLFKTCAMQAIFNITTVCFTLAGLF